MYGWYGFEAVLTDFVDEQAFGGRNLLRYEDYCYYVDAADALEAGLSTDEIEGKLLSFFLPLCKMPVKVDWYDIRFD